MNAFEPVFWMGCVEAVAKVYQALPAEDRSGAAILAYNYGEASAIDYFGPRHGLPRATCGHNQYGFWGPDKRPTAAVVAIGFRKAELGKLFSDVLPTGREICKASTCSTHHQVFSWK